ncbi:MAG: sodium:solute symporter, partial [Rubricoccaceae bacterium]|nr:sodium:solute symporter [Rubricoccaceae bacterium]
MLQTLDFVVIAAYICGVAAFGVWAGGRQKSTSDYFLGGRDLPWWAVCFSVIATETSTLTVIGVPAVSFGGTLTFFQITLGYLIGRIAVAAWFLPRYFRGELQTAYAFLGERFGTGLQTVSSITFMVTRLLADGVRLFATAIPLKIILASAGVDIGYAAIIAIIGLATIVYTYIGGIKAVVWMDTIQLGIYIGGAILAVGILMQGLPADWVQEAASEGKTQILNWSPALIDWLTQPYAFITAIVGGAVFTMASHGSDQLIVQRILACRSLSDGRKAMIGSGVGVVLQFALFLFVGLLLWAHYGGAPLESLGLSRADEVFPKFIVEGMPVGLAGLLLAGIIAAAMSTLSSSLNALAGATVFDVLPRILKKQPSEETALRISKGVTLVWGGVFIGFAMLFTDIENPVVELGLSIASFTYGGLLGAFLLGMVSKRASHTDAVVAFLGTIFIMTLVIFGVFYSGSSETWMFIWRPDST